MEDSEERVFRGKVPVRFVFEGDIAAVPFVCLNVPRNITLGWFFHLKVSGVFKGNLNTMFFMVNRRLVRWYLPVGLIYDTVFDTEGDMDVLEISVVSGEVLYPGSLSCESIERATDHFYHAFKEFFFVAKGDLSSLFGSQNTRFDLCGAIEKENYEAYNQIKTTFSVPIEGMKQWPVKVVSTQSEMRPVYLLKKPDSTDTIESLLNTKEIEHNGTVKIQGVRLPVTTQMKEIYPLLCSYDGFIYIAA